MFTLQNLQMFLMTLGIGFIAVGSRMLKLYLRQSLRNL